MSLHRLLAFLLTSLLFANALRAQPLPEGARLRLGSGGLLLPELDAAALSPDGQYLAHANTLGCQIYERRTLEVIARLPGEKFLSVGGQLLGFNPDGRSLVYGVARRLIVATIPDGKIVREIELPGKGNLLDLAPAFSADGKFLTLRSRLGNQPVAAAHVWELATGRALEPLPLLPNALGATTALSSDGKMLAAFGHGQPAEKGKAPRPQSELQLFEVASGKELRRIAVKPGRGYGAALAFAPDGQTLAFSGQALAVADEVVGSRLYDVSTGQMRHQLAGRIASRIALLRYSGDGKRLVAVDGRGQTQVWSTSDGQPLKIPDTPLARPLDLALPGPDAILVLGLRGDTLTWWDPTAGKDIVPHEGHFAPVRALAFAPSGRSLISASGDGLVLSWDPATGAVQRRLDISDVRETYPAVYGPRRDVALSGEARFAALGGRSGGYHFRLWDLNAGKVVCELKAVELGFVPHLSFAADGSRLAAVNNKGKVLSWETATGEQRFMLGPLARKEIADARQLALSPDGSRLALALTDYDFKLRQITAQCPVFELPTGRKVCDAWAVDGFGLQVLAFAPDGRYFAGGDTVVAPGAQMEQVAHLFGAASGKAVKRLSARTGKGGVTAIALSPDGRSLAVAAYLARTVTDLRGNKGGVTICVWELASGGVRYQFHGHSGRVDALAFSPDGALLASGSADTTVLLWDTSGRPAAPAVFAAKEAEEAWSALAAPDAAVALPAMTRLLGSPAEAVALLKAKLRAVPGAPLDETKVPQWLADLDSPAFARRDAAAKALEQYGYRAEPALRKAQLEVASLEVRRRVTDLLERSERRALDLRETRALEVLERLGGADAQALLQALAAGDATALLTQEAQKVLARMRR
jgi:WD40 repeat protein